MAKTATLRAESLSNTFVGRKIIELNYQEIFDHKPNIYKWTKRAFDIVAASIALILLSPIFLLTARTTGRSTAATKVSLPAGAHVRTTASAHSEGEGTLSVPSALAICSTARENSLPLAAASSSTLQTYNTGLEVSNCNIL